jgi:hypothetical protein
MLVQQPELPFIPKIANMLRNASPTDRAYYTDKASDVVLSANSLGSPYNAFYAKAHL